MKWREAGDRLIVCLNANENIYSKDLGKVLTRSDGLNMSEVVGDFTGSLVGPTFFRGRNPIDGVWATKDIQVVNACAMLAGFGVRDHRYRFQATVLGGRLSAQCRSGCSRAVKYDNPTGGREVYEHVGMVLC